MENTKKVKLEMALMAATFACALNCFGHPANAQNMGQGSIRVNKNALEKATFYQAPREFQIIDNRPIVRDFREPDQDPGSFEIPNGPLGSNIGGPGAGSLGGPNSNMPIQQISGGPRFRSPAEPLLPRSGFGRDTNVPARGMSSQRGALPDGSSTNRLMGKMLTPTPARGSAPRNARGSAPPAPRGNNYIANHPSQIRSVPVVQTPTPIATYGGGGYAFGGSSNKTEAVIRGSLLHK